MYGSLRPLTESAADATDSRATITVLAPDQHERRVTEETRMRVGNMVLSAVVLFASVAAIPAQAQSSGEPKLVLSADSWDFGTVYHLAKREFDLTVKNEGDADLRILEVKSSCGCTVAQPGKYVLAPGESTPINIAYNTRGKDGKAGARLTLRTNDKSNAERIFRITGFVKHAVEMTPKYGVSFRALGSDETHTEEVRLVNLEAEPMHPKLAAPPPDWLSAEMKEIKPGQEYTLVLTTKPPIAQRMVSKSLEISTGVQNEPRVDLSVSYRVIDRVNLLPPAIYVGTDKDTRSVRSVQVQYYGRDPDFRVVGVACDDPRAKVRFSEPRPSTTPQGAGRQPTSVALVTIDFPSDMTCPPGGLPFKVQTTDPEYSALMFHATRDKELYRQLTRQAREISQRKAVPKP